MTLKNN